MKYTSKVTSKGQITIPQEVRDALRIQKGDTVTFQIKSKKDKKASISVSSVQETIDRLFGSLGNPGMKYVPYEKVREIAGQKLAEKYQVKNK